MDIIITGNQLQSIITESYLTYKNLTSAQRKKIKLEGRNIFNLIKKKLDKNLLFQYGLTLKVPSINFIEKNIKDIDFALKNLQLTDTQRNKLRGDLDNLALHKENSNKEDVLLFFEMNDEGDDNEWSFVNMFDNNVTLWLNLMKKSVKIKDFSNLDSAIEFYFSVQPNGEILAHNDLMEAILTDRDLHISKVFSKTWGKGSRLEEKFFTELSKYTNVMVFSESGNYVDMIGIDGAFVCKTTNRWVSVQVKSEKNDALDAIPEGGISVYLVGNKFHFVSKKESKGGLFRKVIDKCNLESEKVEN